MCRTGTSFTDMGPAAVHVGVRILEDEQLVESTDRQVWLSAGQGVLHRQ